MDDHATSGAPCGTQNWYVLLLRQHDGVCSQFHTCSTTMHMECIANGFAQTLANYAKQYVQYSCAKGTLKLAVAQQKLFGTHAVVVRPVWLLLQVQIHTNVETAGVADESYKLFTYFKHFTPYTSCLVQIMPIISKPHSNCLTKTVHPDESVAKLHMHHVLNQNYKYTPATSNLCCTDSLTRQPLPDLGIKRAADILNTKHQILYCMKMAGQRR